MINSLSSWFFRKRYQKITNFLNNPKETQEKCFNDLISKAKNTQWGLKFDYKTIKTTNEYKKRVPIQDYDTLKKDIEKMMNGERDVLWPGLIDWYSKSSGTTSDKSKFIPVSKDSLQKNHYDCGKDMLAIYCHNVPDTKIFTGKNLVLGGSHKVNNLNEFAQFGDISAVLMQNLPAWANYMKAPDLSIALMDEWEMKIEKMAHSVINENITSLVGVPTWTIVLAKRILEITGKNNLLEVWPNLELYIHGAVNFTPYREQFKKLIPSDKMRYLETYNASEGFFAVQDIMGSEEMLLMLDYGIYYEFLPLDDLYNPDAKTLDIHEVELNKNYAIIISTNGGLWRYMIGDTVKFTSIAPYRLQITGRTRHFINAFGEEVIIENAENALKVACKETNAIIKDYTAGPVYFSDSKSGSHEWIIEFEQHPNDLEKFKLLLDENLKLQNSDYEAKRYKDMALSFPLIHIAKEGTFYNWMKQRGKLGGQHKVPRLSNNRDYLDELLKML